MTEPNKNAAPEPDLGGKSKSFPVTLEEPIERGETKIEKLTLRKPGAGQLRGLSLQDIITTDISAMLTLIPRISEPPLTQDEADSLDPADLAQIGGGIRGFFMSKAEHQAVQKMIEEQQ